MQWSLVLSLCAAFAFFVVWQTVLVGNPSKEETFLGLLFAAVIFVAVKFATRRRARPMA